MKLGIVVLAGWAIAYGACASRAAVPPWNAYGAKPDDWYRGDEGRRVTEAVLSYQSPRGSWPKNLDTTAAPFAGDRSTIAGTFDNGATTGEVRFLARAYRTTQRPEPREAVVKALDHVLEAQYPTGGWPQFFPPGKGYHRHITFNDDTMVRLLQLLRDVSRGGNFAFLDDPRRDRAVRAFDAGIACILKCQVTVRGEKTVWCAQHDEVTLEPRPARTFEPVSLSGAESAGILTLLMSLENPSAEVIAAVDAAVRWFDRVKSRASGRPWSRATRWSSPTRTHRRCGPGSTRSPPTGPSSAVATVWSSSTWPRSTASDATATRGTAVGGPLSRNATRNGRPGSPTAERRASGRALPPDRRCDVR